MTTKLWTEDQLLKRVENALPDFAKACSADGSPELIMHQDAFAGILQIDEFTLLGMAIKYAGYKGKSVHIIGRPGSTI